MSNDILTAGQRSSNGSGKKYGGKKSKKTLDNEQVRAKKRRKPWFRDDNKSEYEHSSDFLIIQKMIYKFLSVDRFEVKEIRVPKYTKEMLAKKIGITVEELDQCRRDYFCKNISKKILLPVIALYCSTKWVEDESLR